MAKTKRATNWADRQKAAGVKLELSAYPARSCWKKYHKGKTKYFNHPITKEGYEAALLEWLQYKSQVDQDRPNAGLYNHYKALFEQVQGWYDMHGAAAVSEQKTAKQVSHFLFWIEEQLAEPILPSIVPFMTFSNGTKRAEFWDEFIDDGTAYTAFGQLHYDLPAKWQDRLTIGAVSTKTLPQSVGYWLDDYLRFKGNQALANQINKKTLQDCREKTKKFRDWIGEQALIADITSETVKDYYTFLLQQSFRNQRGYFNAFKTFVKYAWRQDQCRLENLPKNLDDRNAFKFKGLSKMQQAKSKRENLWTKADFKTVLESFPQRYQCWIMLMLNCGFTQTDLNELKKEEIDLKAGRIVRVRTKGEFYDDPPIVNYKLWNKTLELLKLEMSKHDHPELALLATRGARIINETLVTDPETGEVETKRSDNVSRNWQKVRAEYGLPARQLKFIRKTGSSCLNENIKYMRLSQLYLGQTHQTVADKHYNAYDGAIYKPLDEAIAFIGKQFGIK